MKKLLTFLLVIIPISTVSAVTFPDTWGHNFEEYINYMERTDVISGYSDGTFKPERIVNRAEFLKMLMKATEKEISSSSKVEQCFWDFAGERQWFWEYVCEAKKQGIVDGYPNGTFRGTGTVNLAEAVKMSLDAWKVELKKDYNYSPKWYEPYFDAEVSSKLFRVLPRVAGRELTRAEASVVLTILNPDFNEDDLFDYPSLSSSSSTSWPDPDLSLCGNGILDPWEQCDDGNNDNDDGCSSICIIVDQPVYHGALRIDQKTLASTSVTKGAENVLLMKFDAIAGRQNVFITQLIFTADTGSLESGTNYSLYYDYNGDGVIETLVGRSSPSSEKLLFTNINIPVEDGHSVRIELHGDIPRSGDLNSFSVKFATNEVNYVEGVGAVDGRDVVRIETNNGGCNYSSICWIAVNTQPSRLITIGDSSGNLYVTKSTSPIRSRQLLGGTLSDVLLKLNFRAVNEDMKVTKIRIGGGANSIESLGLYEEGENSPFAVATLSSCETVVSNQFCADTNYIVWKEVDKKIEVRANMKLDTDGGESGETLALKLSSSVSGGSVAIEAEGASSQIEVSQNDGDSSEEGEIFIGRTNAGSNKSITGSIHDTVLAKITGISNSSGDINGYIVPSGVSTFGAFRFSSASHANTSGGLNTATIRKLVFSVTAENVEFESNSIEIYNVDDSSVAFSCSQDGTTGIFTVTCDGLQNESVNTNISSGDDIYIAIRGNILDPQVDARSSTLQIRLQGLGTRGSSDPVVWDDEETTFSWIDVEETSVESTLYRIE